MSSRKSTIFMLFGIIIGLCFGIVFKNYRALELVKKCSHRPNNDISESNKTNKYDRNEAIFFFFSFELKNKNKISFMLRSLGTHKFIAG